MVTAEPHGNALGIRFRMRLEVPETKITTTITTPDSQKYLPQTTREGHS